MRKTVLRHVIDLSLAALLFSACASGPSPATPQGPAASPGQGRTGTVASLVQAPPAGFKESLKSASSRFASIEVAPKAAYQVLLEENSYEWDLDGTCTIVTHAFVRVLTKDGVDGWSIINAGWQPWRDAKPRIEARVLRPSGEESTLRQETVVDTDAGGTDNNLRGNNRRSSAPIPNLEPGSLLEFRITEVAREALPGTGFGLSLDLQYGAPVERRVVRFSHAKDLRLSWRALGATPELKDLGVRAGMRSLELDFGPMEAAEDGEYYLPYDQSVRPLLVFGSAPSWEDLAAAYEEATAPLLAEGVGKLGDYVASALGGIDAAADPKAAVAAIAAAVRRDLRYTGVIFGENSIIPHEVAGILAAGYGDCKDQASLLAACLRAAGLDARLALLNAGGGTDCLAEVPGLEFFNHAIVYLPALDEWIDPTAYYCLPGVLPGGDQGRKALVIGEGSEGLALTAIEEIGSSWFHETSSFLLSEQGNVTRIEQVTRAGGAAERALRASYDDASRKEHEEYLEEYGKSRFEAGKASGSFGDPADLSTPFVLTIVAEDAESGWTNDNLAEAVLKAGNLFQSFPADLGIDEEAHPPRRGPAFLVSPTVYVLEFDVVAPPGYRLRFVPEGRTIDLGQALLTESFSSASPETLKAVYELTPKSRDWTAAEVDALRAGAKAFLESNATVASFEDIGAAYLSEGRYFEALAEYRDRQVRHPGEALHHIQASSALIDAGFPDEALVEAESAVSLEPGSAMAHMSLAFALLYDPFGTQFGKGADLARAAAEYLKAFELDPQNFTGLFNYAIVNEFGTEGDYRGAGSRLEEAVKAFERAKGKIEQYGHANRYLGDLFQLGRYSELIRASEGFKDRKSGAAYLLAAYALRDGPDAASRQAAVIFSEAQARREALSAASTILLGARKYAPAADLLLASARGTANLATVTASANLIKGIKRQDAPDSVGTPEAAYFAYLRAFLDDRDLSPEAVDPVAFKELLAESRSPVTRAAIQEMLAQSDSLGIGKEAILDILRSYTKFANATSGPVSFVTASTPAVDMGQLQTMVFASEGGKSLLVDMGGGAGMAAKAASLLASGDEAGARAWISALRDARTIQPGSRFALPREILDLIPADLSTRESLGLGIAVAGAWTSDPDFAAANLGAALKTARAEADENRRRSFWAIAVNYATLAKSPELATLVAESPALSGQDIQSARARAEAFVEGRFGQEAEAAARTALRKWPDDRELRRSLAKALRVQGRYTDYVNELSSLIESGLAEEGDYNNAAWGLLFLEEPDFSFIEDWGLARRFDQAGRAEVHTLACALAAAGRYDEARAAYARLMNLGVDTMDPASLWVLHGLLARSFGLPERARTAFEKAASLVPETPSPEDSSALAAVWLRRP